MNTEARNIILFRLLIGGVLLYSLLMSLWVPFTADSFVHALFGYKHQWAFVAAWNEWVKSYFHWNPRVGEFLAYLFATAGKPVFCLLNPFVLLALGYLIFYMALGRKVHPGQGSDLQILLLCYLLLFTSVATPNVTLFWLSGATNYAWGATIWLGFLCFYRGLWSGRLRRSDSWAMRMGMIPLGFLAGMTNENQVPVSVGMIVMFWVYSRVKKCSLPVWFYTGFIAHFIGAVTLFLAPGNVARLKSDAPSVQMILHTLDDRIEAFFYVFGHGYAYMFITGLFVLLTSIACIVFFWKQRRRRHYFTPDQQENLILSGIFFLMGQGMLLAFLVKVVPACYALFSATLMINISVICCASVFWKEIRRSLVLSLMFMSMCGFALFVCSQYLHYDFLVSRQCHAREVLIRRAIAQGQKNIVVPSYEKIAPPPYISLMWRMDSSDPNAYINTSAARYWGVDAIIVVD